MRKIFEFIAENYRRILVISLFLVSAVIFVLFFPGKGKFRYEFQKGRPWSHEVLIAPFNLPIYKSEDELAEERDSILDHFKPYFRYDEEVADEQIADFRESFDKLWEEFQARCKEGGFNHDKVAFRKFSQQKEELKREFAGLLENIYSKGIIELSDMLDRIEDEDFAIMVMQDQIAEEREYSTLFTQKKAYEYIMEKNDDLMEGEAANIVQQFMREINFSEFVVPNLYYDEETSERVKMEMLGEISLTSGMIQAGERIISRGELVTQDNFRILESIKYEYEKNLGISGNFNMILLGKVVLVVAYFSVLFLFLINFRREVLQNVVKTAFIMLLVVLVAIVASFTIKYDVFSVYILPLAILPIMIRTFYDARLALFIHIVTVLLIGFWAPNSFEFVFLNIIAGIVAIFSLTNLYRRGILFLTAVLVMVAYGITYFGIAIMQEGNLKSIEFRNFLWFGGNGLLLLTAYPMMFIFEKTFGFLSDSTVFELSDTNQPLLRELASKAPGTFQHCMQVANLAEEAIFQIGGNPLLVRTGALYHDVGKMVDPLYFIENQNTDYNPHDELEFDKSAEIIIGHVSRGVEIAKKHNLPEQIIDFIRTHHGTTMVQYFYKSFLKKYPEEETDRSHFTYPGPKPFSKETAVLMMADAVEASSRSLKIKDAKSINNLVDNMIQEMINQDQFDHAEITFSDIYQIKQIFKNQLLNIYHARIEYPE